MEHFIRKSRCKNYYFHLEARPQDFEAQLWSSGNELIGTLDGEELSYSSFELSEDVAQKTPQDIFTGIVTSSYIKEEYRGKGLGLLLYKNTWKELESCFGEVLLLPFKKVNLFGTSMNTSKRANKIWRSLQKG